MSRENHLPESLRDLARDLLSALSPSGALGLARGEELR